MNISRCRCGAEWHQKGNGPGHCSDCHETFASDRAFERHRRVDHCIHPSEVVDRKGRPMLEARTDAVGTRVWGRALAPAQP